METGSLAIKHKQSYNCGLSSVGFSKKLVQSGMLSPLDFLLEATKFGIRFDIALKKALKRGIPILVFLYLQLTQSLLIIVGHLECQRTRR
jgi:hypothetical protein